MLGLLPFRLRIRIEVKLTTKKTVKATLNPISNEKSFSTISWAAKRRKDNNEFFLKHVMYIYNFPPSLPFRIVWYVNRNFRGKKEGRSSILIFILFVYWKTIKKWTRKMLVDTNCYGPFQKAMHHITLFFSVYNNRNCTYIYIHSDWAMLQENVKTEKLISFRREIIFQNSKIAHPDSRVSFFTGSRIELFVGYWYTFFLCYVSECKIPQECCIGRLWSCSLIRKYF